MMWLVEKQPTVVFSRPEAAELKVDGKNYSTTTMLSL